MPTDHDDDDHDKEDDEAETTIPAIVGTTSVSLGQTTSLPTKPTDHPDRPVNNKPTASTTSTNPANTTSASDTSASPSSTFYLPSIFPTFGVSPRTQIWIYGAIATILLFCCGLGAYFFIQRRRRQGTKYESLEMFEGRDKNGADEPLGGRPRRAGELYDAFAGESDEELFSGDESETYRDDYDEKQKLTNSRSHSQSPVVVENDT